MALSDQLTERRENSAQNLPKDVHSAMTDAVRRLKESGIEERAPQVGSKIASFSLPNQNGDQRNLEELLDEGKVILTFYRGGWCPYCNMELQAYQKLLDDIKKAGATLVAISPELPDHSLDTQQKNELAFEVLSDVGGDYARTLGLLFELPESIRPIYENFGIDVQAQNGTNVPELPVPATFIIGESGEVLHSFVDADYTYRQEPKEVVDLL